ncbi:hypothetical protein KAI32_02320 [Candidatus Pacearchaeota archaeon]|nr:hypothetical protein [Candidatus Heimdallarchaeota archaeon]MCK5449675.1 hypothetical protein [Candidatus Pacearchaeota archaeon]
MELRKPKYVYHGSPKRIKGKFTPKIPRDLGKNKHNIMNGVYASSVKNKAIGRGVCVAKGVISARMGFDLGDRQKGVIYKGWPAQKYIYLHTFDSETFERYPKNSTQFVSMKAVKPVKIEKLLTEDYLKLIRKASKKELNNFIKKYGVKK